jgi:hypothetical protein
VLLWDKPSIKAEPYAPTIARVVPLNYQGWVSFSVVNPVLTRATERGCPHPQQATTTQRCSIFATLLPVHIAAGGDTRVPGAGGSAAC